MAGARHLLSSGERRVRKFQAECVQILIQLLHALLAPDG
jgi:hypothetical protein